MLSNTGLYVTQPSRFEDFENGDDFMSYAPISDLSLSTSSSIPDLSNQLNDPFLSCFTNSENFDSFDDWSSQDTLSALDTTSWETSNLENQKDIQSPFDSPVMDWPSSPMSSHVSNGGFSPINGASSSKHTSMSFDEDFTLDFEKNPTESNTSTPSSRRSPSPESESAAATKLSQEEIAKLWAVAFPNSHPPSPKPYLSLETSSTSQRTTTRSPSPIHQKRKSIEIDSPILADEDVIIPSKKRVHTEEVPPAISRRTTKRTTSSSTPASTNGVGNTSCSNKGSKVNHNLIEKRYRSSLNEKIALLRDALPKNYGSGSGSDDEDMFMKKEEFGAEGHGNGDGKQSTKGAVLSDAARYIAFLEGKVNRLEQRLSMVPAF